MSHIMKIFGPPGCGKTYDLLTRLEQELKQIEPNRIAFLSFTRAARGEALERSGRPPDEVPYLRTIHSVCFRELKLRRDWVVRPKDIKRFGAAIGVPLSGQEANPWDEDAEEIVSSSHDGDRLLRFHHLGRHQGTSISQVVLAQGEEDLGLEVAEHFSLAYTRWKKREDLFDFTDFLEDYLETGKPLPVDVLFVDEAQDLTALQWRVVERMGANAERWYLCGDDDQAIFQWAGAEAQYFLDYPADEKQFLVQSHRLPTEILHVATQIAGRIRRRETKQISPRPGTGSVQFLGVLDKDLLEEHSGFLLVRNRYRARKYAEQLRTLDIGFGGFFSPLTAMRDILSAWQKVESNREWLMPVEARALMSALGPNWTNNFPMKRTIGLIPISAVLKAVPKPDQWAGLLEPRYPQIHYADFLRRNQGWQAITKPRLEVMTIHQAKGREAESVFLDTCLARKTYLGMERNPDDEHRVQYVGVTRAKKRLFVLDPDEPLTYPIFD